MWAEHDGLLQLEGGRAPRALLGAEDVSFVTTDADDDGPLWVGGWPSTALLRVDDDAHAAMKAGPTFAEIAVAGDDDLWLVTRDIEWRVVRYDGASFQEVAAREDFPGRYTDNKLSDLAVTPEGAWLSCWNGLYQFSDDTWEAVAPPQEDAGDRGPWKLFSTRHGLVARYPAGAFLRDGEDWRKLPMPPEMTVWDVNRAGLAVLGREGRLSLMDMRDAGCVVEGASVAGMRIHDVALDARGRAWIATDYAQLVLGPDGEIMRRWRPGELDTLTGSVAGIAIVGAGPATLPLRRKAVLRNVTGRVKPVKGGTVSRVVVELCNVAAADRGCRHAAFERTTTAGPGGAFELEDVPAGDFAIVPDPAEGVDGCGGIFRPEPLFVSTAHDCRSSTKTSCDLGTLSICEPFEKPPPR